MKRLLLLALCALFAADAGARTLYVDAERPNNKGNGLSAKKAKKTLQAAVNVAKKGDTILVRPGSYSAIRTKNKRIAIKSVKGKKRTTVKAKYRLGKSVPVLDLGNGRSTKATGFSITRRESYCAGGSRGGIVMNCTFRNLGLMYDFDYTSYEEGDVFGNSTFFKTTLRNCVLSDCSMGTTGSALAYRSELSRCRVSGCGGGWPDAGFYGCVLANGLVEDGHDLAFTSCTIVNCTVVDGRSSMSFRKNKAVNTVFAGVGPEQFGAKRRNALANCRKGKDPGFVDGTAGDYRLAKGSPCIDAGRLTAAQKKLVGTKDLAGRKRVRGKAVDIGCHEY